MMLKSALFGRAWQPTRTLKLSGFGRSFRANKEIIEVVKIKPISICKRQEKAFVFWLYWVNVV